jgi:hypothetical protein
MNIILYNKAIQNIFPGVGYTLEGTDYSTLGFNTGKTTSNGTTIYSLTTDEDYSGPTEEQILVEYQRISEEEPMRLLRIERDKLLAETDWVTMRSYSTNTPVPEEWASYQQALRDLPTTATPVLDPTSKIGISGFDWPVKPQ